MCIWVRTRKHILHGVQIPTHEGTTFSGTCLAVNTLKVIQWGAEWYGADTSWGCTRFGTHWTIHVQRQCGLMSNYTDHLLTWGDGEGRHWLVWMEWHPAGRSVCLPLLIFPCTIKSRSSLLAPGHPVKRLWWCVFRGGVWDGGSEKLRRGGVLEERAVSPSPPGRGSEGVL